MWMVPGIISVNSPDGDGTGAINRPGTNTWLHEALFADNLPQIGDQAPGRRHGLRGLATP